MTWAKDPTVWIGQYELDGSMDYKEHKACDKYSRRHSTLLFDKDSSRLVAELIKTEGSADGDFFVRKEYTQWDETKPDPKVFDIAALEEKCGCTCEPYS